MAVLKRIVCLANSRKFTGRCIAGKEREGGAWIRPVSDRPSEEVSERERAYEDGSDPEVLDVIDVPLKHPHPKTYQSENWLLDPGCYWERVGRASWRDLAALVDNPPTLWTNRSSTYYGQNDRVDVAEAAGLSSSLYLVRLERLVLNVFAPGVRFGNPKRRVHGEFSHNGVPYHLWVTDPHIEREYLAKQNGVYAIGVCYVTVSLGEPHDDFCYKLVAAVITPERAKRANR